MFFQFSFICQIYLYNQKKINLKKFSKWTFHFLQDGEALSPFLLLNIILKPWALYVKQTEDDSKMKRRYGLETSEPRRENVVSFLGFRFASCTLDVERNKPATWKRQRAQKKSTLFPVSQKPGKRQPRKTKLFGNNCSTPAETPPEKNCGLIYTPLTESREGSWDFLRRQHVTGLVSRKIK